MPDPDALRAVMRHGRSALAWEILRRDPAYREAYYAQPMRPNVEVAVDPAFTALWGLHFR